jgi:hypothetical protein
VYTLPRLSPEKPSADLFEMIDVHHSILRMGSFWGNSTHCREMTDE